jgi:hypothetical protein
MLSSSWRTASSFESVPVAFKETIMRVLGISGSPRRGGNTDILINTALEVLAAEGIETKFLSLADRPVKPCVACGGCFKKDVSFRQACVDHFEGCGIVAYRHGALWRMANGYETYG